MIVHATLHGYVPMAKRSLNFIFKKPSLSSVISLSPSQPFFSLRQSFHHHFSIFRYFQRFSAEFSPAHRFIRREVSWIFRHFSHGIVNVVISEGKPKFESREIEPSGREKWKTKKRLKMQRMREKKKRKAANKRDPRRLGVKGKKKKQKFPSIEAKIKYKIEKAKIKEALLIERLKRYEVPKLQGPTVEPGRLTGEERFYLKKMGQKGSNYVPVGRRGIFGGVILNMHLHWKKHETVKVICKPCKRGQVHEYAKEIARLSGGTPIQIIGDNTIIFYRGKDYVQPEVMSPVDTLSKKKALEKSKYEQSLESVRRFIAISEKELELYCRHVALYGDPNSRNSNSTYSDQRTVSGQQIKMAIAEGQNAKPTTDGCLTDWPGTETNSEIEDISEIEIDSAGDDLLESEIGTDHEADIDSAGDDLLESEIGIDSEAAVDSAGDDLLESEIGTDNDADIDSAGDSILESEIGLDK